jgi:hypothetical protein
MRVLGCSGIRVVSSFNSMILADLVMRGFAISVFTLVRVALPVSFVTFPVNFDTSSLQSVVGWLCEAVFPH